MTIITSKSRLARSNTPVVPPDPDPVADPNYTNVVSLLRCNGVNGSTSIVDEKGNTVTNNGSPIISISRFKWGASSLLLNGSSSCTVVDPTTTFVFSDSLTIEFWLYLTSYPVTTRPAFYLGNESNGRLQIGIKDNGAIALDFFGFGEIISSGTTSVIALNSWHHLAITRYQPLFTKVVNLFVNGVSINTYNLGDAIGNTGGYTLGSTLSLTNYLACYLDDVRVTKNVARYTSNFTPPATPFANF